MPHSNYLAIDVFICQSIFLLRSEGFNLTSSLTFEGVFVSELPVSSVPVQSGRSHSGFSLRSGSKRPEVAARPPALGSEAANKRSCVLRPNDISATAPGSARQQIYTADAEQTATADSGGPVTANPGQKCHN